MSEERQFPKGNCIAIYPDGDDLFVSYLGKGCEGWAIIAHGGQRFIQVLPPNMKHPITITTQIERLEDQATYKNDWLINPIKLASVLKYLPPATGIFSISNSFISLIAVLARSL